MKKRIIDNIILILIATSFIMSYFIKNDSKEFLLIIIFLFVLFLTFYKHRK